MSIYNNNDSILSYSNNHIAFDVGALTKDTYSINMYSYLDLKTDVITYEAEVVKNWSYSEKPKDLIETNGKKYKEILFNGKYSDCIKFIEDIVNKEGHYIQDPKNAFYKLFIEPINK